MPMMFIRFFEDKENQIPFDSHPQDLSYRSDIDDDMLLEEIKKWMAEHPKGKVDFVWSNC